nr:PorP/SprF family type IX secretion system membrane protein [uncultured Carboxylicivirga sp.]
MSAGFNKFELLYIKEKINQTDINRIIKYQLFQCITRRIVFFLLFCVATNAIGQQFPQFSQNMFNQLATNPGFAGNSEMINVAMGNRQQWMGGFDGMAPKTTVFGADAKLNILGGDSGLGLLILNDEIGEWTNLYMSAVYSKRWKTDYGKLGVGLSFGMVNQSIKGSNLSTLPQGDASDDFGNGDYHTEESLTDDQGTALDIGFGTYLENRLYYIGISVAHLNKPAPKFKDTYESYLLPIVFITGGYKYQLKNRPIVLVPSLFIKSNMSSYQVDFNVNGILKDKYWGGLTYRFQDAIVLLGGVELNNGLRIGYSYDINVTQMSSARNGSHEIMLGYSFDMSLEKRKKQYKSVRYL